MYVWNTCTCVQCACVCMHVHWSTSAASKAPWSRHRVPGPQPCVATALHMPREGQGTAAMVPAVCPPWRTEHQALVGWMTQDSGISDHLWFPQLLRWEWITTWLPSHAAAYPGSAFQVEPHHRQRSRMAKEAEAGGPGRSQGGAVWAGRPARTNVGLGHCTTICSSATSPAALPLPVIKSSFRKTDP